MEREKPEVGCTVPNEIDFPRYNMKCSGENEIDTTWNISGKISCSSTLHVISRKFGLPFQQCGGREGAKLKIQSLSLKRKKITLYEWRLQPTFYRED